MGQVFGRIAMWAGIGAVLGGITGSLIGAFAPQMYVNWFDAEYVERVGGLWIGVWLGVPQGAGLGALVGLATVVLPWLNRKTATQIKVSASYDAATDTVRIENKGRVPVLVFGVWALREVDTCAEFDEPLLISEGSKEVTGTTWRDGTGVVTDAPRTGPLATFVTGPTVSS